MIRTHDDTITFDSIEDFKNTVVKITKSKDTYTVCYFDSTGVYRMIENCHDIQFSSTNKNSALYGVTIIDKHNNFIKLNETMLRTFRGKETHYRYRAKLPSYIGNKKYNVMWLKSTISILLPNKSTIDTLLTFYDKLSKYKKMPKGESPYDALSSIFPDFYMRRSASSPQKTYSEKVLLEERIRPDIRQFITKVNKPIFEREYGNNKKNTFDFIRILIAVKHTDNQYQFIDKNKREIIKIALNMIEKDKRFAKYGVPINILKVGQMTLTAQSEIMILFEIKNLEKMEG